MKELYIINKKGITLIALIITIIVLLVISGVMISLVLTNNGVINKSMIAKEENEINQHLEVLRLEENNLRIKNKDKEEISVEEYDNWIKSRNIENMDGVLESPDKQYSEVVMNKQYVYLVTQINEKYIQIEYEGLLENLIKITNVDIETTETSINISNIIISKGTAKEYKYYYKLHSQNSYENEVISSNDTQVYNGLKADTEYDIKILITTDKNKVLNYEKTVSTSKIPTSVGNIIFGQEVWNGNTATVELKKGPNVNNELNIQYQINTTEGEWINSNQAVGLKYKDILYARLTDGVKSSDDYESKEIQDNEGPETFSLTGVYGITETEFYINTVTTVDNQSGLDSIEYYTNTSLAEDNATLLLGNYVTGLSDGTTRYVWAVAKDKCGNTRKSSNYCKVTTKHTHNSQCYNRSNVDYHVKNMGLSDSDVKDTVAKIYCSITSKLSNVTYATTCNWSSYNDNVNGNTYIAVHYSKGHYATCLDCGNFSSTTYRFYEYCCPSCGRWFISRRNGYTLATENWTCAESIRYLPCIKNINGSATLFNF